MGGALVLAHLMIFFLLVVVGSESYQVASSFEVLPMIMADLYFFFGL